MSVTRDNVARLARVSPITVSRVFSGLAAVSPRTQDRVLRAAQRCGYTPHAGARSLRKGQFNRVALAVVQYGVPGTSFSPNMQGYMEAATYELAQQGYSLVLEPMYMNLKDEFLHPPRLFSELGMDGVLGLPVSGLVPPQIDGQLKKLGSPVVWINRTPSEGVPCVYCDERANGRALARHLTELGHTRIGYIGFDSPHYSAWQRHEGVRSVLAETGLDPSWLVMESRQVCINPTVEEFLDRRDRPTAVICAHRNVYDAVIQHCSFRGICIPRDLSVCYFASEWEVVWKEYKATVLAVPEREMAARAVGRLLEAIHGRQPLELESPPITGEIHPGWTTSRPGESRPQGIERCDHEKGICVVRSKQ